MRQLGMSVMLDIISKSYGISGESPDITKSKGKEITSIHIDDEYNSGDGGVVLTFDDGSVLTKA